MPDGRLDGVAAAQILADRFCLGWGLDNDECAALCWSGVGNLGIRRGRTRVRALLARCPFFLGLHFFWFHFHFFISHSSTFGQTLGLHLYHPAPVCASRTTSAATCSALFASVCTVASAFA